MKSLIQKMIENIKEESYKLCDMEYYVLQFIEEVEKHMNPVSRIAIYKDDYTEDIWKYNCDQCNVTIECDEIIIPFNQTDIQVYQKHKKLIKTGGVKNGS